MLYPLSYEGFTHCTNHAPIFRTFEMLRWDPSILQAQCRSVVVCRRDSRLERTDVRPRTFKLASQRSHHSRIRENVELRFAHLPDLRWPHTRHKVVSRRSKSL